MSTPRGTAADVTLACTDPEGDAITLEKVAGPSHGTLGAINQATKKVNYTPAAGYSGPDSFTYRASDGTATSPAATVSITVVAPPNTAPLVPGRDQDGGQRDRDRAAARLHRRRR